MPHEIVYPQGCRPVNEELGSDELIRRLKVPILLFFIDIICRIKTVLVFYQVLTVNIQLDNTCY